eukprot:TRINITY_DN5504_c0_g2_i1.p1 TRINITY_DN5504_c0_g2~~TRINITY_DN5504_c0_g2_i1.p1  ORF type:complete len:398 (-),score=55.57 TRINITY_DN5504_c0_g2_i1:909-1991(-)
MNGLLGEIDLAAPAVAVASIDDSVTSKPFSFQLVTPSRTFYMFATSNASRNMWIEMIGKAITQGPGADETRAMGIGTSATGGQLFRVRIDAKTGILKVAVSRGKSKIHGHVMKKRWCVLQNEKLYYLPKNATQHSNHDALDLRAYDLCPPSSSSSIVFELIQKDGTLRCTFAADSTETAKDWVDSLAAAQAFIAEIDRGHEQDVALSGDPNGDLLGVHNGPNTVKSGLLHKHCKKKIREFKTRFFVLTCTGKLLYYKSQRGFVPQGDVSLGEATVLPLVQRLEDSRGIDPNKFFFELRTPRRTYRLYSDTETEMRSWVDEIKRVIASLALPTSRKFDKAAIVSEADMSLLSASDSLTINF